MSYEAWGEPDDSPYEAAAEDGWINPDDISKAMIDVMNERARQWDDEGFSHDHDDLHGPNVLAQAAGCYLLFAESYPNAGQPPPLWPWDALWWKPKDWRRDSVRAAALIIADIERLDRMADQSR